MFDQMFADVTIFIKHDVALSSKVFNLENGWSTQCLIVFDRQTFTVSTGLN